MKISSKVREHSHLPANDEMHAYLVLLNGENENTIYEVLSGTIEIGSDASLDIFIPEIIAPVPRVSLNVDKMDGAIEVVALSEKDRVFVNGESYEVDLFLKDGDNLTVGNYVFRVHFQRHQVSNSWFRDKQLQRKNYLLIFILILSLWIILDEEQPINKYSSSDMIAEKALNSKKAKKISIRKVLNSNEMQRLDLQVKRELRFRNYRRAFDMCLKYESRMRVYQYSIFSLYYCSKSKKLLLEEFQKSLIKAQILGEQRSFVSMKAQYCEIGALVGGIEETLDLRFSIKGKLKRLYENGKISHPSCD